MSERASYSTTIEQMRDARRVPTALRQPTAAQGPRQQGALASLIHPRLRRIEAELARMLRIDDPAELHAALLDMQTELERSRHHLRFARVDRVSRRRYARSHPAGKPGRPAGSANMALRQLGLALATLWHHLTGEVPTRRVDAYGRRKLSPGDSRSRGKLPEPWEETGPYRDFVALIIGQLPGPLRATRKASIPAINYLVRMSIEEFALAQASGDEARRRGLLLDERWLRPSKEPMGN